MNNVTITLSHEQMIKIKVIDLDEFYNFFFMTFSSEIILGFQIWFEVVIF
jgi:hypothetical protein